MKEHKEELALKLREKNLTIDKIIARKFQDVDIICKQERDRYYKQS